LNFQESLKIYKDLADENVTEIVFCMPPIQKLEKKEALVGLKKINFHDFTVSLRIG
jgi:hypothetical protein